MNAYLHSRGEVILIMGQILISRKNFSKSGQSSPKWQCHSRGWGGWCGSTTEVAYSAHGQHMLLSCPCRVIHRLQNTCCFLSWKGCSSLMQGIGFGRLVFGRNKRVSRPRQDVTESCEMICMLLQRNIPNLIPHRDSSPEIPTAV